MKFCLKELLRIEVVLKKYILSIIFCFGCTIVTAAEMSVEKQYEIIENYMYVTGQLSPSKATAFTEKNEISELSGKCGMAAVREFKLNFDKFDKGLLKSSGVLDFIRPDYLTRTHASPSGRFLIHFATTGDHAVYQDLPGGSLGYVDSVARIFDEVYEHIVDSLGYPEPIRDSFYAEGGDEKYDVYLIDLADGFYGLAYPDSVLFNVDSTVVTSTGYLELDKDYQDLYKYKDSPLDAVRVTAAHEFFHMVQFGIDLEESERISSVVDGPAWMEMSAVWMEEEIYDDINDYYIYLPFFFSEPWASIQRYESSVDIHAYASSIFPIFLSEKFDRDIVKSIWMKCGEYGAGPHFLQVVGEVIDSATAGTETYESVFAEFALWNYFTGSRAKQAPEGIGYSEREAYESEFSGLSDQPFDPTPEIREESQFPFFYPFSGNRDYNPSHNSAFYLKLKNIDHLIPTYNCIDTSEVFDTTYWICNDGTFPSCNDSTEVTVFDVYDTVYVDSFVCSDSMEVLKFAVGLDATFSNPWGISVIFDYKFFYDSVDFESSTLPAGATLGMDIPEPSKYNSVTFVFTPASANRHFFTGNEYGVGFSVSNSNDTTSIDSAIVHVETSSDIFFPYPNPAVLSEMSSNTVKFSFQLPNDSTFLIESTQPDTFLVDIDIFETIMIIDIYNINGEIVRTLSNIGDNTLGLFTAEWDIKNQSGKDVSSGVYFAYARILADDLDGKLLMEKKTKIAVIR